MEAKEAEAMQVEATIAVAAVEKATTTLYWATTKKSL